MKRLLGLLAGMVMAAATPATAQDSVALFYKGRQVTVLVGSSAGGGYDIYARLLARHMGKYIPGNPTMIVSNMPGAASNAAVAHLYNVAQGTARSSVRRRTAPSWTGCSTACSATHGGCATT